MKSPNIDNIHFIGTSHIARESVSEIESFIEKEKPFVVAVELDKQRLTGLLENRTDRISLRNFPLIRRVGLTGFIFAYIASLVQKKLGNVVKSKAGKDMLTAVNAAKKHDAKVALIDQEVDVTLKKLSKEMRFREKARVVLDIIRGLFSRNMGTKELGIKNIDLTKVPPDEIVEKVVEKTKGRYPSFYKVLIEDRNKHMVNKLFKLMLKFPEEKILAVVGAGHKKEMKEMLEKRLKKYGSGKIDTVSYSYSFSADS